MSKTNIINFDNFMKLSHLWKVDSVIRDVFDSEIEVQKKFNEMPEYVLSHINMSKPILELLLNFYPRTILSANYKIIVENLLNSQFPINFIHVLDLLFKNIPEILQIEISDLVMLVSDSVYEEYFLHYIIKMIEIGNENNISVDALEKLIDMDYYDIVIMINKNKLYYPKIDTDNTIIRKIIGRLHELKSYYNMNDADSKLYKHGYSDACNKLLMIMKQLSYYYSERKWCEIINTCDDTINNFLINVKQENSNTKKLSIALLLSNS